MAQQAEALTGVTILPTTFTRKPTNLYRDAFNRLLKNKGAVLGLIVIAFYSFVAIFATQLAPHNALEIYPNNSYRYPMWVQDENPNKTGDAEFPLGTDTIGRDVLSRAIYGTRTSLVVGFIPMTLIILLGTLIGMTAGYFGGRIDNFLMRLTDIVYAFPDLLFFIIMLTALRETGLGKLFNGLFLLFVSLAIVNWTGVARLVRGQVLAVKEKDFVEAARSIGANGGQIMTRHLFPNSLAPIIVSAAFLVPQAILTEAILGFIGVGIRPATDPASVFPTSWGNMLLEGREAILSQPWLLVLPAFLIASTLLSFTFVGDGLRDALDPMMKGRV
ncbi:MAG: ABC transporter permease [Chloroflexi bacterium]|nr:ABC transporter permease [Chloroflexota bacterium]